MSFAEELKMMSQEVSGCRGALIMSLDGISVASHVAQEGGLDLETLLVELAGPLRQAMQALSNVEAGELKEMMVASEQGTLLVRMLKDDHFAALFLFPSALVGKARYVLRRHSLPLMKELS